MLRGHAGQLEKITSYISRASGAKQPKKKKKKKKKGGLSDALGAGVVMKGSAISSKPRAEAASAAAAVADAPAAAKALIAAGRGGNSRAAWRDEVAAAIAARQDAPAPSPGAAMHPAQLFQAVQKVLDTTDDPILIVDGGEAGQWAQACLSAPTRMINGPSGAIGGCLCYAVAAKVARPMSLRRLFTGSPLGTVGIFLLGGVYATQSGMAAVFGTEIGMSADAIALLVAMLFGGALLLQYPIGWLSDRMDRRKLIFGAACRGGISCGLGWMAGGNLWFLMAAAFFAGGVTTPLYALFLAYTNDYLSAEEMPSASGGLVFTFGLGAIAGPLLAGWAMGRFSPSAFWLVLGATFATIALYALYRMTQRAVAPAEETESYLGVLPTASPVAVEAAGAWAAEQAESEREAQDQDRPQSTADRP